MLKKLRARLGYHLQAVVGSLNYLFQRPMSTLLTSIVIAIALALPALFWVFSNSVHQLTAGWKHSGRISLYLQGNLAEEAQQALVKRIQDMKNTGKVTLISAKQGLEELQQQEGMQDIAGYLPQNPLPPLIEVIPALSLDREAQITALYQQLKLLPEVDVAKLDLQWMNRLNAILKLAMQISRGLMLLLACAVVLIVGNTLRLAIQNRYEEIQVLKLIGATDAFIVRPFLYSGLWYGLSGAIIAVFLVNIFLASIALALNHLALVYQMHDPLVGLSIKQTTAMIAIAMLLGWLGARISVNRQLAAIEPV